MSIPTDARFPISIPISEMPLPATLDMPHPRVGGSPLEGRSHFYQNTNPQYTNRQYTEDSITGQRTAIPLGTSTARACGHPEGEAAQCNDEPRTIAVAQGAQFNPFDVRKLPATASPPISLPLLCYPRNMSRTTRPGASRDPHYNQSFQRQNPENEDLL